MIAALPMYERPETVAAHDRFWALIREECPHSGDTPPDALIRGVDLWTIWQSPDLYLAQTCGLPYRARLHGRVTLLGAPDYRVEGAPPGHYHSVILVRRDDPRDTLSAFAGAAWAVNEGLSQSGWAAPSAHLASLDLPPIARVRLTGAHRASAHAVARGEADIAALDAVTWRLMEDFQDVTGGLRVLARTSPTPGLPMISAPGRDATGISAAIPRAIDRLDDGDRAALGGIADFVPFAPEAYSALPPAPALPKDTAMIA